eukprot:UN16428
MDTLYDVLGTFESENQTYIGCIKFSHLLKPEFPSSRLIIYQYSLYSLNFRSITRNIVFLKIRQIINDD